MKRTRNDDEERDVECHENHDGAVNGDCPVRNASVTFHDEEILEVGNRSDSSNEIYGSNLEEENADWRAEQYQDHSRDCYDQVTEEVSLPKHFQLW